MTPEERDAFVDFAVTAAAAAGAAILPHFRASITVTDKGGARGYDPVTEADRAAESVIRTAIAQAYPTHGICGEEPIVATTDPRHFESQRQRAAYGIATDGARLVRFGGDCYCYTQLAMGLVDIVIETGLQAYDIQSLIPLIEAAGGIVTTWTGASCDGGGDVLACG